MKRRIIQGLLLIDISRLIEATTYLKSLLQSSRFKVWYIHSLM